MIVSASQSHTDAENKDVNNNLQKLADSTIGGSWKGGWEEVWVAGGVADFKDSV